MDSVVGLARNGESEMRFGSFIVRDTDEYITLAVHLAYPDDPQVRHVTGIMAIPLGAVL